MARNTFSDVSERITAAEVAETATALGIVIPDDVVRHYAEHNGGTPSRPCWEQDGWEPACIAEFLPIKHATDGGSSLENSYLNGVKKGFLPRWLIPFAVDWGGNYFCFDEDGQVYFVAVDAWRENLSNEENQEKATRLLSRSFKTFVDKLVPEE
jgi:cell wall assembly regulator SMI1